MNVSKYEMLLIDKIVERAKTFNVNGFVVTTLYIDLCKFHEQHGLRLHELIVAKDGDFTHDVFGIYNHMNRETGQLEDCFWPRYAL